MKKQLHKKHSFKENVIRVVKRIPKGKTLTYKEVAERAGSSGAARAVGSILKKNQDTTIPCHRVVRSDGMVGGYNGLRGDKTTLLAEEKIR